MPKLTLPVDWLPPPADVEVHHECPVRGGRHYWVEIKSYSAHLWWPAAAYAPFCTFCGRRKPVDQSETL